MGVCSFASIVAPMSVCVCVCVCVYMYIYMCVCDINENEQKGTQTARRTHGEAQELHPGPSARK